jgi:hypothetical protein
MSATGQHGEAPRLRLLPAYLGVSTLEEGLTHPRISRILWLEILVNDQVEWLAIDHPLIKTAYQTASRWYTQYRTLVSTLTPRAPLPIDKGPVDERYYRQFAEALHFAHTHP